MYSSGYHRQLMLAGASPWSIIIGDYYADFIYFASLPLFFLLQLWISGYNIQISIIPALVGALVMPLLG